MATLSLSLALYSTKPRLRPFPTYKATTFPLAHFTKRPSLLKSTTFQASVDHRPTPTLRPSLPGVRSLSAPDSEIDENLNQSLKKDKDLTNPVRTLLWVVFWASLSIVAYAFSGVGDANAAVEVVDSSIKASGFGLKIAGGLRGLGWPDEAVVFALATLPVIELRGAIPVGYWMQLNPVLLTLLAVIGNMVPVPFIVLYLKTLASFLAGKNQSSSRFLDMLLERAEEKAGPVKEFQWLGLMLFVAVPFPGTGAWTGAIIASILDMPFWPAVSANFFGVVLAGLLVNLLVNLGLRYAIVTGIVLFIVSTFMWSILRNIKKSLPSD